MTFVSLILTLTTFTGIFLTLFINFIHVDPNILQSFLVFADLYQPILAFVPFLYRW